MSASRRAAILSTGDEVLTGQIVDSNAAWLAERMGELGFEVVRHETVGDDRGELERAFRELGAAVSVVLCTGGLGPTVDDLTSEIAARVLGCGFTLDPKALAYMEGLWRSRGREMPENNKKQAMIPALADVLDNPVGTAPGFAARIVDAQFFFMPGVPREMKRMFDEQVTPRLHANFPAPHVFSVRVLRCFGLTESALDRKLGDFGARFPHVKLGFRAHFPEIQIKLTGQGDGAEAVAAALDEAAAEVRARVGDRVFSEGAPMEQVVGEAMRRVEATVTTAESCTGGLVAELITNVPGASAYFKRGYVVYANEAKTDLLGVSPELLAEHGAVSEACARAMAEGARARAGATFAAALTGVAGPDGGTAEKPVGTVWIAVAGPSGTVVQQLSWPGDRAMVRGLSAMVALDLLRRAATGLPTSEAVELGRRRS
ncbi:MAG TPA: competence/damage-inducible protein A [Byssovorax sp.]